VTFISLCSAWQRKLEHNIWKHSTRSAVQFGTPGPRESIAYPYMDFQRSTDINMDIHYFYVSLQLSIKVWISTLISKQGYPFKDILQWISVNNKYPWMDIYVLWISDFNYWCFYGYPFGNPWISMDIHTLTCYGSSILGRQFATSDFYLRLIWRSIAVLFFHGGIYA